MRCALLHGFAGDPRMWADVIAAWPLAEPPRAVALSGHGGGPVHDTWDANLDAVARAVGDCDVVVGYSLGARVALGLVASDRIRRGVLISVNPGISDDERPVRRASDAEWARVLRERGIAEFAAAWTAQPLFASQQRVAPEKLAERHQARLAHDPESLARSLETMGLAAMPDYRPSLPALRDRLALIAGGDDAKFRAIAEALPLPVEILAGCGHDPTLEAPERLAAAIGRALQVA